MYTNIPGVQILISLLKQFNVCHVVISPGTRNTAFVGSIEEDPFFHCYSIVDERSAGFFALGIAEVLDVPVCVSCTAATATANYAPAMKEAFERGLQLIALTADQDTYTMFHMEDQCINQVDMFHDFVKLAVDVPKVENKDDYWYCNRKINEALLEMNHHGKGPIQINYRMNYSLNDISAYPVVELPVTRKITRIEDVQSMFEMRSSLKEKNRILLVCGSNTATEELRRSVNKFYGSYNCVVVYDTFSNLSSSEYIRPTSLGDIATPKVIEELKPDLIITVGNVFYSTIKYFLPRYAENSETWQISVDGMPIDGYRNLKFVFECLPETFFSTVTDGQNATNNHVYDNLWKKWTSNITVDNLPFTNFSVIQKVCSMIPAGSILHTSVLDAIRMSNYVEMNCEVSCFANIGADGIDGALSTFLGQAHETDRLSFLLIGDLSLMYDMNALYSPAGENVRICVINNYAGAEFHKNFGKERIPMLEKFISAGHHTKMQQCSTMNDFEYLSASSADELEPALAQFVKKGSHPILLEVFTNADTDAKTLKAYWASNRDKMPMPMKGEVKKFVKRKLPRGVISFLKRAK